MLFLLILIISLILQFFLPWWIIALVAFGLSFWKAETAGRAFGSGFLAIFALWIVMSLIQSIPNENLLANRVAEMLTLPASSFGWLVVLLVTGVVGGLVAGLSAVAGFYCRSAANDSQRTQVNAKQDLKH